LLSGAPAAGPLVAPAAWAVVFVVIVDAAADAAVGAGPIGITIAAKVRRAEAFTLQFAEHPKKLAVA
jgi:hypothetical protein